MVSLGRYKSQADAIRAMAVEQAQKKIAHYERRVKRFQKKHRTSFENYTKRLQNRATITQEDEWMKWETAIDMLEAWRTASKALEN